MRSDFIFRSGKFKGKSYEWVSRNASWYINWVMENRPEMLREHSSKNSIKEQKSKSSINNIEASDEEDFKGFKPIQPNLNFDNEGPYKY